ncbi:MAG TPA: TIR domain-containing protein, partial [Gemmataceae bacterium]|nr:TIR domain-containing protein [Gemmataceae bacterium]
MPKRFRIAFSFAGEKRAFVEKVAHLLPPLYHKTAILYDKFHEAEFARRDLGMYLPELYHDQSDLVVVVICKNYQKKEWCGLEWQAIHALLKGRKDEDVMLCRFDRASLRGLFDGAGVCELDDHTPHTTVELILQRLARNENKPVDYYFYCLATVAVRSSMVVWRYARDGDSTAPARCA